MTKHYFLAAVAAILALPASSAVPFMKGQTPPRVQSMKLSPPTRGESQTLVDEDFSRFTGGTEDVPGEEISYVNLYGIPEELTSEPGWSGGGIYPSSGSIALMERTEYGGLGFISTPAFYLGGTATLTFRARTLPGSEGGSLWVSLCDDYYGPGDDQKDFVLTANWTEYTMVASHGSLEDKSYFQLQAENGFVQIDDVRIDFKRDRIMSPRPLRAVNLSPTSFKAMWESVDAPLYRLNVLCKEEPEDVVRGVMVETFDGINLNDDGKTIDTTDPNYPEGWEIDLSTHGSQDVGTEIAHMHSAPVSLLFDAVGDVITSPETPQPIDGLKFWVRPSKMEENPEIMSLVRVEIFHTLTGKWEAIANLPYYWMTERGDFYEFPAEALGDDCNRVRLSFIQRGDIDFYIDDVTLSYSTRGETVSFIKDLDVEDTEYIVENIRPENEYSYYVQAIDGDLVSEPSYMIWVDGVEGLKPEILAATDVTSTSFTANWKSLGHATDYRVETSVVIEADTDMDGVLVNEETFDGITDTGTDWISPYSFVDSGKSKTAWGATNPQWKPGMAGTQGTSWTGTAGLVFSPNLDLSGNNGEGFDVEATVETTVASVDLGDGTSYPEGMFVMVLNTPDDNQALCSAYFDTPEVGLHTAKVHVPNPEGVDLSNVIVAFMNVTGTAFFVDEVKIMQDLKKGDTLVAPLSVGNSNDTHLKIENLNPGSRYGYAVTASVSHNYEKYVSERSDMVTVDTSTVGVDTAMGGSGVAVCTGKGVLTVNAPADAAVEIYSAGGMRIAGGKGDMSVELAAGIYVVKAGEKTMKVAVR